jgi:hypothetical protein
MSGDFDDKEQNAPADGEDVSSPDSVTEEAHDESRRGFLKNLGKWSGAVIGIAVLGSAVSSTDADADPSHKPEESWRCWRCWRCRCRCRCRCM